MPKILNTSQQVRVTGLLPRPAYSRTISLHQVLPADGNWYVSRSASLGNKLWILGIDLWATPIIANDNNYTDLTFRIGQGDSWSVNEVTQWEEILPITTGAGNPNRWQMYDGTYHHHWDMIKYYGDKSRRLAILSTRPVGMGFAALDVSFEISEG